MLLMLLGDGVDDRRIVPLPIKIACSSHVGDHAIVLSSRRPATATSRVKAEKRRHRKPMREAGDCDLPGRDPTNDAFESRMPAVRCQRSSCELDKLVKERIR